MASRAATLHREPPPAAEPEEAAVLALLRHRLSVEAGVAASAEPAHSR